MSEFQTREQMLFGLEREAYLRATAQARADGYAEGVEAAAKVADRFAKDVSQSGSIRHVAAVLGSRIRALTAPSGKEGT